MIRSLLLGCLGLLVVLVAGFVPPSDQSIPEPSQTYVYIDYVQISGDYRRAWVTVRPARAGARLPWRSTQASLHLSLRGGRTHPAASLITIRRQSDGTYRGFGLVPDPRRIERLLVRGDGGRVMAFRVPEVTQADGDDDDPPAEDPPTEDPPDEDPPEDDDCGPIPPGCEVYNPWTCQCDIGLRDPWGDDAVMTGRSQLVIGF